MDQLLQEHADEIRRIAARHGARRVRVFGSRVRGRARPDSDLDVLVDLETGRSLFDLVRIKLDLEQLLGCTVDVGEDVSPYIRKHVLQEAVEL